MISKLSERIISFLEKYPEGYSEAELKGAVDAELWKTLAVERGNVIEWLPVRKNERVLELGAGYGELTTVLLRKGAFIDAAECDSDKRAVLSKRYGDLPSYRIFPDVSEVFEEKRSSYDWILINGGFVNETVYLHSLRLKAKSGESSDASNRLLLLINELKEHLTGRGHIVLITDNRMGMSQLSVPDHRCGGEYYSQFTGAFGSRGQLLFTHSELSGVFEAAGVHADFYYPYPDAYFPESIYSDERLPEQGELQRLTLCDPDGIRMFDDSGAWDTVIREGVFASMASTFLCLISFKDESLTRNDYPLYVKYSLRRKEDYRICTELRRDSDDTLFIRKRAYDSKSAPHIGRMGMIYGRLRDALSGRLGRPAKMTEEAAEPLLPFGGARFDYIQGEPLDVILDRYVSEGKTEEIYALLDGIRDVLFEQAVVPFVPGARFLALFSMDEETARDHFEGEMSLGVTDVDLIPANIIDNGSDRYVIDYEWTLEEPIPIGYIWYRFLHYYIEVSRERRNFFGHSLYHRYGITDEKEQLYQWMEESFQQFVKGDREPMYAEISRMSERERTLADIMTDARRQSSEDISEVFAYADGKYTLLADNAVEKRTFPGQICSHEVRVHVPDGCEQIRLDPAEAPGILVVESVTDQDGNRLNFSTNGVKKLSSWGTLFDTDDPMLMVSVNEKIGIVSVRYQYDILTAGDDSLPGRAGEERRRRLLSQRVRCAAGTEKIQAVSNDFIIQQVRRSLNEDNIMILWGYYPYENEQGAGLSVELDGVRLDHEIIPSPVRIARGDILHDHMLDMRIRLPEGWEDKKELAIFSGGGENRKRIGSVDMDEHRTKLLYRVDGLIDRNDGVIILGYAAGFGAVEIFARDQAGHTDVASVRRVPRFDINQEIQELSRDAKVGFEIRIKKTGEAPLYPISLTFKTMDDERVHVINEGDFAAQPARSTWQKLMHYGRRSVEVIQTDGFGEVIRKAKRKLSSRNVPVLSEYEKWCLSHTPSDEEKERQRNESQHLPGRPSFSIVVPVYHTKPDQLKALIESVKAQTYDRWELCLADAGGDGGKQTDLTQLVSSYTSEDERIRYEILAENRGIAENTNSAIEMSTGEYIVLLDHDDLIEPDTLYECAHRIANDPTVEVLYSDQDMIDETGEHRSSPVMKPDLSIDLLRSRNYISHIFVAKRSLIDEVGMLDGTYDGSQDYDLILRCVEKAKTVVHIPRVLYHWRTTTASTADDPGEKVYAYEAGKRAIEAHYKRLGIDATVEMTDVYGIYRTTYHYSDTPMVSIIIPNKDHRDDLARCVTSILEKETYPSYEIVIVENNSEQPEIFDYYDRLSDDPRVRIVNYQGEFNFSAVINCGAGEAKGEYLLLLNNDVEEIDGKLITELMNYGQREDVGVVGARLYYEDETIQHAGVIIGYGGLAGHAFKGFDRTRYGSLDRIICAQDYSAVTAACMLTRADVFRNVGGFSQELAVAYNDVDYCLKVRRMGKLVVYTPYAIAYHYESSSRGYEDTPEKRARYDNEASILRSRWRHIIDAGDPYYNPNLSLDKDDFSLRE